jgi:DNA-binding transcriptional LysR family regulator
MNWQAISFDWNQVRAFLATAEEGSLSAAARALRSTQPTVGRQVAALEGALQVTLFERVGRSLVMTTAGLDLLEHVRAMGDAAGRISLAASGQSQDVAGQVSITASDLFSALLLPDMLAELRKTAPGIEVVVVASNKIEDLARRDADIAIRHVRPEQPELIARHIADFEAGYYAATTYLDAHGRPRTPSDYAQHSFVGPIDTLQMIAVMATHGITASPAQFRVRTDSGLVMMEMMRAGLGITVMPDQIWDNVQGIERLSVPAQPIRFPVWLTTHRELRTSRRIRCVFDALAAGFESVRTGSLK